MIRNFRLGLFRLQSCKFGGIDRIPVFYHTGFRGCRIICRAASFLPFRFGNDGPYFRQAEFGREFPVALIVGGNCHNGARSVRNEHIIGYPNGNGLACRGVYRTGARPHTCLCFCKIRPFKIALFCSLFNIGFDGFFMIAVRKFFGKRMFGGQHHIACTEDGIGACGIHLYFLLRCPAFRVRYGKVYFGTLALSYPVTLHLLYGFRPVQFFKPF